jgi:secretion/DNA translocation related TadE-like protein
VTAAAGESGSATVLALGAVLVLLTVAGVWLASGRAALARQRAETAADLAALAAAQSLDREGAEPCTAAGAAAAANGGRLLTCSIAGDDVTVAVSVSAPMVARAVARAGPQEPQ